MRAFSQRLPVDFNRRTTGLLGNLADIATEGFSQPVTGPAGVMIEPNGPRLSCRRRGHHVDNQVVAEPDGKPLISKPLAQQIANHRAGVAFKRLAR